MNVHSRPGQPGAGEGALFALDLAVQVVVDEGGIVVRVDATQREGQPLPDDLQRAEDGQLPAIGHSDALRPACRDVGSVQGANVLSADGVTAMGDQVQFQKAWLGVIPIGKGAHRDCFLEQRAWFGRAQSSLADQARVGFNSRSTVARLTRRSSALVSAGSTNSR